jgi:hypothetical protein
VRIRSLTPWEIFGVVCGALCSLELIVLVLGRVVQLRCGRGGARVAGASQAVEAATPIATNTSAGTTQEIRRTTATTPPPRILQVVQKTEETRGGGESRRADVLPVRRTTRR